MINIVKEMKNFFLVPICNHNISKDIISEFGGISVATSKVRTYGQKNK